LTGADRSAPVFYWALNKQRIQIRNDYIKERALLL